MILCMDTNLLTIRQHFYKIVDKTKAKWYFKGVQMYFSRKSQHVKEAFSCGLDTIILLGPRENRWYLVLSTCSEHSGNVHFSW